MTTRDVILREIGLTPVWRSRANAANVADNPAVHATASPQIDAVTPQSRPTAAQVVSIAPSAEERSAAIAKMSWTDLRESIASCTACALCKTRTHTVPGVGDLSPSWMVIGEAPGENEDKLGEPFVGKAGQLLDAMLAAVNKKRGAGVYIANVIKCRPPGNRNPEPAEIAACAPYLKRQIALAEPKLLLAAGKFAAQTLLNREDTVGAMRAVGGAYEGVPVVVTYHPSYLLRSPLEKAKAWEDLIKARSMVP
ncbi:MAG TPA: uracil-DNA glycosylase [Casimicrobium sp.]|nr:uracil-DNA glycosylase [Casimicrobium sp.]